jgi:tryptophan synthase alpha chain
LDASDVAQHVGHLKQKTAMPVAIGFGIRDGDTAYQMAKLGDAIIVGSALVSLVEQNADQQLSVIEQVLSDKMREFKQAINKADSE